jgi:ribosomal protein S12 methylthiotransferase accessory factor YcaO
MNDEYDAIALFHDADEFRQSRFGKHYLARLEAARGRYLAQTQDDSLNDSQRAHAGSKAAVVSEELAYFQTVEATVNDKSLLERLREGIKKRKEAK